MSKLLSPAGSPDALRAAIDAGADEVYLGGTQFNARAGAKNFTAQQLVQAGQLCRDAGVSLHITLNTLVYDREIPKILDEVAFLQREVAPQAYIVQDLGLVKRLKERFPELILHASTQLRQHSGGGVSLLKALGFSRVVLARELSKEDIASFVQNADIESEVFVHGALCVCESGGCLMSSMIGRRSGNRGECAQPCRLAYRGENPYPLSLKDQCLAAYIPALCRLGVTAFKIEGRMKAPNYVYTVTSVYRRLIDEQRAPTEAELQRMRDAFSRSGFTAGYYENKIDGRMFGIRRETDKKKTEQHPEKRNVCTHKRSIQPVEPLAFRMPQKDVKRVLPAKQQLGYVARFEGAFPNSFAAFSDAVRIDLPLWRLKEADIRGLEERVSVILPRVVFDREEEDVRRMLRQAREKGVRHATVPNLSLLHLTEGFYLHGDYPLNLFNRETVPLLEGYSFSSLFVSPEADPKSFGFSETALEALGYGRVPLMHTQTCIIRNVNGACTQGALCTAVLTDRTGASFPLLRGYKHRNLLYNSLPSYRLDKRKEWKKAGVGLMTLLFTTETERDMQNIRDRFLASAPPDGLSFTRR